MPYQIVDDKSVAGYAQAFAREPQQFVRLQVMDKERASHNVEAVVAEGKRQRISADIDVRTVPVRVEMRSRAVQDHGVEFDAAVSKRILREGHHVACTARHVQPRKFLKAALPCNLAQQPGHYAHAAEAPVEHAQVPERIDDFAGGPAVGVEQ